MAMKVLRCLIQSHLALVTILLLVSHVNSCYDAERSALITFRSLLTDPSGRLSSWQGENCCNWQGIKCSDTGHVVVVNLRNPSPYDILLNTNAEAVSASNVTSTAISGIISPAFFSLNHIRYLDLSFNNFMYSKLPEEISNLTELVYLNLSNAMFRDVIRKQFANLTSLRSLDLSCAVQVVDVSKFSVNLTSPPKLDFGPLFSFVNNGMLYTSSLQWLEGLYNLRDLSLNGVDLSEASQSASWAAPVSLLSNLRRLELSLCRISGRIPVVHFLNLTHLNDLRMDSNELSSSMLNTLANLTSLSSLSLRSANLSSSVPYLPQIIELYVGNNPHLSTDLSSLFALPWPNLEALDIDSTFVGGTIPHSFGNNTSSLVYLWADSCSIYGPLPSSILKLSKLEFLSLNNNDISGQLPEPISNLKNLLYLSLSGNQLVGAIPDSICLINSLQYLNLGINQFTGNFPHCISQLPDLSYLNIMSNELNDTILLSLFQNSFLSTIGLGNSGLTIKLDQHQILRSLRLQMLDLTSCNLEGDISSYISNWTQLTLLSLGYNNLSGTIPHWLFQLPRLSFLDLSMNSLQGVLPQNILLHSSAFPTTIKLSGNRLQGPFPSKLKNVEVLDLSNNSFTGYIAPQLGESVDMRFILLSGNKLVGPIPESFCQENSELMGLDLSDNSLSGTIPTTIGNCTLLMYLNLGQNNLSSPVPGGLSAATSLRYLDLSSNAFDGFFPSVIQKFQQLQFLNLENNNFEGKIPQLIRNLQNLRILLLATNRFNGTIPQEMMELKKLQFLRLSRNRFSGTIPQKLNGLEMLTSVQKDGMLLVDLISLTFAGARFQMVIKGQPQQLNVVHTYNTGLDLSWNALSGTIPEQISLLNGLPMLSLAHNELSGHIPTSIGNMTSLESLDLSFNNLNGEIPVSLTSLDSLQYLNLSYNNLSGRIPCSPHFDTLSVDGSSYTANPFLCGAPGGLNCTKNDSSSIGKPDGDDAYQKFIFLGIVTMGYALGLSAFFLALRLMGKEWREQYWRVIDRTASKIVRCYKDKKRA